MCCCIIKSKVLNYYRWLICIIFLIHESEDFSHQAEALSSRQTWLLQEKGTVMSKPVLQLEPSSPHMALLVCCPMGSSVLEQNLQTVKNWCNYISGPETNLVPCLKYAGISEPS